MVYVVVVYVQYYNNWITKFCITTLCRSDWFTNEGNEDWCYAHDADVNFRFIIYILWSWEERNCIRRSENSLWKWKIMRQNECFFLRDRFRFYFFSSYNFLCLNKKMDISCEPERHVKFDIEMDFFNGNVNFWVTFCRIFIEDKCALKILGSAWGKVHLFYIIQKVRRF